MFFIQNDTFLPIFLILQRHVTMLFRRIALTLVLSHLQCLNQLIACIFRQNNLIDVSLSGVALRYKIFTAPSAPITAISAVG